VKTTRITANFDFGVNSLLIRDVKETTLNVKRCVLESLEETAAVAAVPVEANGPAPPLPAAAVRDPNSPVIANFLPPETPLPADAAPRTVVHATGTANVPPLRQAAVPTATATPTLPIVPDLSAALAVVADEIEIIQPNFENIQPDPARVQRKIVHHTALVLMLERVYMGHRCCILWFLLGGISIGLFAQTATSQA
jgi:hypothetical protein